MQGKQAKVVSPTQERAIVAYLDTCASLLRVAPACLLYTVDSHLRQAIWRRLGRGMDTSGALWRHRVHHIINPEALDAMVKRVRG